MTTCQSGVTACIVELALAILGAEKTALYDGSWAEYGATDEPDFTKDGTWEEPVNLAVDRILKQQNPEKFRRVQGER